MRFDIVHHVTGGRVGGKVTVVCGQYDWSELAIGERSKFIEDVTCTQCNEHWKALHDSDCKRLGQPRIDDGPLPV